jgi:hypothetical protein
LKEKGSHSIHILKSSKGSNGAKRTWGKGKRGKDICDKRMFPYFSILKL